MVLQGESSIIRIELADLATCSGSDVVHLVNDTVRPAGYGTQAAPAAEAARTLGTGVTLALILDICTACLPVQRRAVLVQGQ